MADDPFVALSSMGFNGSFTLFVYDNPLVTLAGQAGGPTSHLKNNI